MKEIYNQIVKKVCNALGITAEEYEDIVFDNYFKWCQIHSFSFEDFQKLLADTALFNWYMLNYHKLETEFLEQYRPYNEGATDPKDIRILYEKNVFKMKLYYYCRPLLVVARTKEIINIVNDENIG